MKKLRQKKHYLGKIMNNISDKNIILIILFTILFVFFLVFSVKSPERNVIDSPIMWKEDLSNFQDSLGFYPGFHNKQNINLIFKYKLNSYVTADFGLGKHFIGAESRVNL